MKNYDISISNGLLSKIHHEKIGSAVWEFMWLIDKQTDNLGKVLGGKPINLKDISDQLGTSTVTSSRNLNRLEKGGYISMVHAPYGIVITINKPKKRFNKSDKPHYENDKPRFKNDKPNKTVTVDNTVDNPSELSSQDVDSDFTGREINEAIESFRPVNPMIDRHFSNKTQRKALSRLFKIQGHEKVTRVIALLQKTNRIPYFPTITTPLQLEEKWATLEAQLIKEKAKSTHSGKGIA